MEGVERRVCPFMSKPYSATRAGGPDNHIVTCTVLMDVPCLKERCMAWGEVQTGNGKGCRLIP